jgi:hypothetical protein
MVEFIQHTLYINLLHREDRKLHVENELKKIGIQNAERFNAIKLTNGALGCSMSHLRCIEYAKKKVVGIVCVIMKYWQMGAFHILLKLKNVQNKQCFYYQKNY